jgi:hypothetical protein
MEKTLEVHLQELREQIATRIEEEIEQMMPPVDEVEFAIYNTAMHCAAVARGTNES